MKTPFSRWLRRGRRPDPLAPDLRRRLESHPHTSSRVIVRVTGEAEQYRQVVENHGLRVHRVFRLTSGLAVEGTGEAILNLADQPWVLSIEADRAVHTMSEEDL